MTTKDNRDDRLAQIGLDALDNIRDMVAAMEVDYDRLEELRDERDTWDGEKGFLGPWAEACEADAAELAELEAAAGNHESAEDARQAIMDDPLSIQVRSGWVDMGDDLEPEEFELLLCTGGPAVRIRGDLSQGEPLRAYLQVQDWGTPWTDVLETGMAEACLAYASCFCFER